MRYRSFVLSDLYGVADASRECFDKPLSKIALVILSLVSRIYVAVEEGNIAGYLVIGEKMSGELFIFHLGVRGKYQKTGVASGFIEKYVDRPCYVRTHVSNDAAVKFYKKHGFNISGRSRYQRDEEEEYLMERRI